VGLTFNEAKILLEANGLVIGAVVAPGISDTSNAYIAKQNPERLGFEKQIQHIRPGQTMDIWLQIEKPPKDTTDLHLPE
ncbi:MAG: PASTA domain-containing protein, partial [Bacteroidia bacterium]|nr:PASTA domain-containing protein [Bacteroidia bacterium]